MADPQAGKKKVRGILTGLKPGQQRLQGIEHRFWIPALRRDGRGAEPSPRFTQEDHGPMGIASLSMQQRNRQLHHALKPAPIGVAGFVPELFEQVMGSVPIEAVEQINGLLEPGVSLVRRQSQRRAARLAGSLRRRIDSGVTSRSSSEPMYSSARSRVI